MEETVRRVTPRRNFLSPRDYMKAELVIFISPRVYIETDFEIFPTPRNYMIADKVKLGIFPSPRDHI